MNELEIGKKYCIHSYKHDGTIHRSWDEAILLDINDEYLVFGNDRTAVQESDGRVWRTKEPAVMYFFKKRWFNIIGQNKKDGIYYYCNMASPYIIEDDTIKYVDYDLDLRVLADGTYILTSTFDTKLLYVNDHTMSAEEIAKAMKGEDVKITYLNPEPRYGYYDDYSQEFDPEYAPDADYQPTLG